MSDSEKINKKVTETLALLDRMEPLHASPHFYARIVARLHNRQAENAGGFFSFIVPAGKLRPAYLALLMLVNIVSAAVFLAAPPTPPKVNSLNRTEYKTFAAQMVKDYSLSKDTYTKTYTNTYDEQVTEKMAEEKSE